MFSFGQRPPPMPFPELKSPTCFLRSHHNIGAKPPGDDECEYSSESSPRLDKNGDGGITVVEFEAELVKST